jgi:peroxin-19
MLNDFSAAKSNTTKVAQAAGPGRPSSSSEEPTKAEVDKTIEDILSDDDFAKQLQAGMADLLGELESSVSILHFLPKRVRFFSNT